MVSNNRRLAINSLIMYIQVILGMVIGFFSARVLLNTLGATDYGTYNVVAGFVSTMAVVSGPMVSGIQRFFAYDIGKADYQQLSRDFNTTNIIYILLGIIVVMILETAGLWFLNDRMTFENGRMDVVNWVYQFSIFSFFLSIIAQPYNALILAHENILVTSIFSIIERIGHLIIVLSLRFVPYDHLVVYSSFFFLLSAIMRLAPQLYCVRKYRVKIEFVWDKQYFKSIFSYSAYNTIGVLAGIGRDQGVNVVLNIFYGPVVNAARAISRQLQSIVSMLYFNIFTPIRPQITKYYAQGDYISIWNLMESASKIMFYVCMIVAIPLWFEADYVLKLWLGNYPEYTITFLRISLLMTMFSSSSVLNCAVLQSANKIRREQLFVASINLMTLPLSYMALKVGLGPVSPFVIATILQFVALLVDVMVVQYELKKNMSFFFGVLIRLYFTLLISSIPPLVFTYYIEPSFVRVILTSIIGILSSTVFMYIFCLNKNERLKFRLLIHKYIKSNEN